MSNTIKKVFIVLSHPEPGSFNHAMTNVAKTQFESQGCEVKVSDLYAMNWDPVSDRRNLTTIKDPNYFQQGNEENFALKENGFNAAIKAEMDKVEWCDLLVFQFPINWFSVPAMLKSWVDKVFASGWAYGGGKWYDNGVFKGKKAVVSMTTGAPGFMYEWDSIQGDLSQILFPVNHGIFFFCGFQPLEPFVAYGAGHMAEARVKYLEDYASWCKNIDNAEQLKFLGTKDCRMTPTGMGARPQNARMQAAADSMMKAWEAGNGEEYKKFLAADIRMVIPQYGVDVTGFETIWGIRTSMGADPLNPHVTSNHTFPAHDTVVSYCEVKKDGVVVQRSNCTFKFDAGTYTKCVQYNQVNL